jgi:hypothetical protein
MNPFLPDPWYYFSRARMTAQYADFRSHPADNISHPRQPKKVYESLTNLSNNSYSGFQVAEVGYDHFMARHSRS